MASPVRYYLTFVLGFLEMIFFGGLLFGWASLVYVLKADGYYEDLCEINETITNTGNQTLSVVCATQDANLNLVFAVATFTFQGCMFFLGYSFDSYGTRFSRLFLHFLLVSGFLMIILSSPSTPDLLFPATICIATGGVQLLPTNLQIGNLFGNRRSTVMTALSGAYDASSFVLLLIKLAYTQGVSLNTSFSILIGVSIPFFINTFIMLPDDRIPWPLPPGYGKADQRDENVDVEQLQHQKLPCESTDRHVPQTSSEQAARFIAEMYRNNDYPSLKSCVFSPSFGLLTFWMATLQLKAIYYVGTLNPYLVQLTDGNDKLVSHLTEVFSFIQFGGIFIAPLGGLILDRNKGLRNRRPYDDLQDNCLGFAITSGLFVLFSICNIVPIIELQYITFVLQVVTRALLYGILLAAIANTFPSKYFGSLMGIIAGLSAILGLIQFPLFIITQKFFNNDPFNVNVLLLVASGTTLIVPTYFFFYARKKNGEVDHPRQSSSSQFEIEGNIFDMSSN